MLKEKIFAASRFYYLYNIKLINQKTNETSKIWVYYYYFFFESMYIAPPCSKATSFKLFCLTDILFLCFWNVPTFATIEFRTPDIVPRESYTSLTNKHISWNKEIFVRISSTYSCILHNYKVSSPFYIKSMIKWTWGSFCFVLHWYKLKLWYRYCRSCITINLTSSDETWKKYELTNVNSSFKIDLSCTQPKYCKKTTTKPASKYQENPLTNYL